MRSWLALQQARCGSCEPRTGGPATHACPNLCPAAAPELEAGGQVTILGTRSEDEQGADLSHLTTAAAQAEPDTAGTQPGTSAGPAEGPAGPPPEGGGDGGNGAAAGGGGEAAEGGEPGVPPAAEAPSILPPEYLEPPSGECNAALQVRRPAGAAQGLCGRAGARGAVVAACKRWRRSGCRCSNHKAAHGQRVPPAARRRPRWPCGSR